MLIYVYDERNKMIGGAKMMRQRIRLDTMTDVQKFVEVASKVDSKVTLEDNDGHCVNAASLLGALYSMEWAHIYVYCEKDISGSILPWII